MSRSAKARTLAEQGVPRSEISKRLGITREAVRQAIGRKQPRPGRPPGDRVRIVLRLPRNLYDHARTIQKDAPASVNTILIDVLAKQLLPESEWKAYKLRRTAGLRAGAGTPKRKQA